MIQWKLKMSHYYVHVIFFSNYLPKGQEICKSLCKDCCSSSCFRKNMKFCVYNITCKIIGRNLDIFTCMQALDKCKEQEQFIEELQGPLERLRKDAQSEFDKVCNYKLLITDFLEVFYLFDSPYKQTLTYTL